MDVQHKRSMTNTINSYHYRTFFLNLVTLPKRQCFKTCALTTFISYILFKPGFFFFKSNFCIICFYFIITQRDCNLCIQYCAKKHKVSSKKKKHIYSQLFLLLFFINFNFTFFLLPNRYPFLPFPSFFLSYSIN